MTTTVKAADAAQFLSLVPRMLGYLPSHSLVLIPFAGSRSLGALRFDLPPTDDSDDLDRVAATLIGTVCRIPDADAVAAVIYTGAGFADGMPHGDLARSLEERADECGLHLTDLLCVGADAWGSYLDPAVPIDGRSLDDLDDAPPGVEDLPLPDGDQASGAELPEVDPAERQGVARSLRAIEAAVQVVCGPGSVAGSAGRRGGAKRAARAKPQAPAASESDPAERVDPRALVAVCRLDDLPVLFEEALEWDAAALAPFDAAALVWCLARPALRDIALVAWCGGRAAGDEAFDAQLKWEAGEEYPAHLAMHMWGEGQRPDPARLERALALVRQLAAVAPSAQGAGCLATAAWLAWALGRSTHADRYALQACELEPEHGLGEIVRSFVHAGHLPDWAFRRP